MSLVEKFDKDIASITATRGETYGHPADSFALIVRLKGAVEACRDPELRHVLEQLCVKMARLVQTPAHYDSWLDVAGYAKTALMVLDRRAGVLTGSGNTYAGGFTVRDNRIPGSAVEMTQQEYDDLVKRSGAMPR